MNWRRPGRRGAPWCRRTPALQWEVPGSAVLRPGQRRQGAMQSTCRYHSLATAALVQCLRVSILLTDGRMKANHLVHKFATAISADSGGAPTEITPTGLTMALSIMPLVRSAYLPLSRRSAYSPLSQAAERKAARVGLHPWVRAASLGRASGEQARGRSTAVP